LARRIVCLAGGVGASRFLEGLVKIIFEEDITIIVNTADDIELYGLHISPDLDIVMYTLAGVVDRRKGWGIQGDTFNCLQMFQRLGLETWFQIGDKDLATHVYRTELLRNGFHLNRVTDILCQAFGLRVKITPITNQRIASKVTTEIGEMHFEEYLVKKGAKDKVLNVVFEGVESAHPAPGVIESIESAEEIIVCPSNPIVSIGPILAVKTVRVALKETAAKVTAISPIVGGTVIRGPADKMLKGLGLEVSAYSVAYLYRDFIDTFILDTVDRAEKRKVEGLGLNTVITNTVMRSLQDKVALASVAVKNL